MRASEPRPITSWSGTIAATPWPEAVALPLQSGVRVGCRAPSGLPGFGWYREAHNDYVQLLVETGAPGC